MHNADSTYPAICVCLGDDTIHHLDHLAPIAFAMKSPLIHDTERLHHALKRYYPQVSPLLIPLQQDIITHLALHCDCIFYSNANYRKNLEPLIAMLYQKQPQFWYCPHGNSDKPLSHYALQDRALIYGNQMKRRLIQEGYANHLKACIPIGNLRAAFYQKHRDFYDSLVEKEILSRFAKKRPLYFYAPTWRDWEETSSFPNIANALIEQLPDTINLIVKLHPWLERDLPHLVYSLEERYKNRSNLIILSNYPLVLPILKRVDLYIGDASSIGYDFLLYNRPMFFIQPTEKSFPLSQCGIVIPKESYDSLFSFIAIHIDKQKLFKKTRTALYNDAFKGKSMHHLHLQCN